MTTEAETGVMWPGVQACQQPQQLEEARRDSPRACRHLDFGFLNSRIIQEYISVVLSHQFVAICYSSQNSNIFTECLLYANCDLDWVI